LEKFLTLIEKVISIYAKRGKKIESKFRSL